MLAIFFALALTRVGALALVDRAILVAQGEERARPLDLTGDPTGDPTVATEDAATPLSRAEDGSLALDRGLQWLAARQSEQEDGSFPRAGGEYHVPVAAAALGALAFMASGSSPGRGPFGVEVTAAVDYLVDHVDLTPSAVRGYIATDGDRLSRMHGHGFATLALAEAYSQSPRTRRGQRLEEALNAAVRLIERSQGVEGGWYYEPVRGPEHEGSVTICLVQALRAAREAGIDVDTQVIRHATAYVARLQREDGSFRYALDVDRSSVALTAAGVATLNAVGDYSGPVLERGMEALWRRLNHREIDEEDPAPQHPHYERFYLAQALWQYSDSRLFDQWIEGELVRVLGAQRADGSWSDERYGDCYATAMTCLFLALPSGLLPIFQR